MSRSIRLSDLFAPQIRMMAKLDDGYPHEDSVGRLESAMIVGEFWLTGQLAKLGLFERVDGRDGQVWYRLSETGRAVREEGETRRFAA